jgi:hypothetical protein
MTGSPAAPRSPSKLGDDGTGVAAVGLAVEAVRTAMNPGVDAAERSYAVQRLPVVAPPVRRR